MQVTAEISHVGQLVRLRIARPDGTGSVDVTALIDTGAGMTTINPDILDPLGLPAAGNIPIQVTGAAVQARPFYAVALTVRGDNDEVQVFNPFHVNKGDVQMDEYQGLIGRDLLRDFEMFYDGPNWAAVLTYMPPPPEPEPEPDEQAGPDNPPA
jgi:predicted aspartyl protease